MTAKGESTSLAPGDTLLLLLLQGTFHYGFRFMSKSAHNDQSGPKETLMKDLTPVATPWDRTDLAFPRAEGALPGSAASTQPEGAEGAWSPLGPSGVWNSVFLWNRSRRPPMLARIPGRGGSSRSASVTFSRVRVHRQIPLM